MTQAISGERALFNMNDYTPAGFFMKNIFYRGNKEQTFKWRE